jgi:hypothetical protein
MSNNQNFDLFMHDVRGCLLEECTAVASLASQESISELERLDFRRLINPAYQFKLAQYIAITARLHNTNGKIPPIIPI